MRPRHFIAALLAVVCAIDSEPAASQIDGMEVSLEGGLGFASTRMDSDAAAEFGIHPRSLGGRFFFSPHLYEVYAFRVEFGVDVFAPLCLRFAGDDCDGAGNPDPTAALSASLAAGVRIPAARIRGTRLAPGVMAGREWMRGGIGKGTCLNCSAGTFPVRAGYFLEPAIEISGYRRHAIALGYRVYERKSELRGSLVLRYVFRGVE